MEAMPALIALVTGVTSSLHCVVMCGPLACAGAGGKTGPAMAWQGGRLLGYASLGALLGAVGSVALHAFAAQARLVLPWLMAAGLLFTAFDLGRWLKPVPGLAQIARGWVALGAKFSPRVRAAAMGAVTPLLPCGLAWGMALAALATGTAQGGLLVMGAFAVGGVPALSATQAQARLWPQTGRFALFARRAVPMLAAAVLIWRALALAAAPEVACH